MKYLIILLTLISSVLFPAITFAQTAPAEATNYFTSMEEVDFSHGAISVSAEKGTGLVGEKFPKLYVTAAQPYTDIFIARWNGWDLVSYTKTNLTTDGTGNGVYNSGGRNIDSSDIGKNLYALIVGGKIGFVKLDIFDKNNFSENKDLERCTLTKYGIATPESPTINFNDFYYQPQYGQSQSMDCNYINYNNFSLYNIPSWMNVEDHWYVGSTKRFKEQPSTNGKNIIVNPEYIPQSHESKIVNEQLFFGMPSGVEFRQIILKIKDNNGVAEFRPMNLKVRGNMNEARQTDENIMYPTGLIGRLMANNCQRLYTSPESYLSYGFNQGWQYRLITQYESNMPLCAEGYVKPQDGEVICSNVAPDSGTCYVMAESKKVGITNLQAFLAQGYSFKKARFGKFDYVEQDLNHFIENGNERHQIGTLVNDNGTIYVMGALGRIGIPSQGVFQNWGLDWTEVVTANANDALPIYKVLKDRPAGYLNPFQM